MSFLVGPGDAEPGLAQPTLLKPAAQYRSEAAIYDAAIRAIDSLGSSKPETDADAVRMTAAIHRAASSIDFFYSKLVAVALANPALLAWTRRELAQQADLDTFVADVKRDPSSVRSRIAEIAAAVADLQTQYEKLAAVRQKVQVLLPRLLEAASADAQCTKTWAVVTAIVLAVVSITVATATFSSGAGETAAVLLAKAFTGTGPELARRKMAGVDQRHAACVAAITSLPESSRARALLACKNAWFAERAACWG
jgi:hypothetical protein